MKLSIFLFFITISIPFVNAQSTEELDAVDIYGDLSKYLSWPLSATAFSGDDLSMLNRNNSLDITDIIPNFSKSNTGVGSYGDVTAIRGLTNSSIFGSPSVVLYVDDVPTVSSSSDTTTFYGTEKIEFLRGAQNTMFGLNSYGAVMNITSRRPSNELEASLSSSYAEYNSYSLSGNLMGPLNDENTISYRLGFNHYESDGIIYNPFLGVSSDTKDQQSFNGTIYFNPNDDLEISLSASFDDFDDGSHRLTPLSGDPFTLSSDVLGSSIQETETLSLRVKNSGDSIDFLSVTSGRNWDLNPYYFDLDFSSNPGNESSIYQFQETRSQEFRFSSVDDSMIEWSAGLYYGDTEIEGSTNRGFIIPLPPEFGGGFSPVTTTTDYILDEQNYALFGQLSYNSSQDIGLHLGLRADQYDKSLYRNAFGLSGPVPTINLNSEYSFISPRLGIDCELSDSSLVYFNSGTSYKPGGYSAFVDNPVISNFKEEKSWSNEIGLKKRWFDDKVRTNIAIFHHDIDDYQVERTLVATDYAVLNAEEAESYGAEIEFTTEIFTGLTLEGSVGKVNTELTKFKDPISGDDISGNKAPFVPELDVALAVNYVHDSGFFARLELIHQGEIYYSDVNNSSYMENGYNLLNASIGYRSDSGYELTLFGTNVTDELYYVNISPDLNAGSIGMPKMLGVKASWNY